jgi:hypothetical protein
VSSENPTIVVVIREDPLKTHRPVEALRIALGLSTGSNPLTVVLLGESPRLLCQDIDDIVDVDILEKHLPVLKELGMPFVVTSGAPQRFDLDDGYSLREASDSEIRTLIAAADRVLTF